MKGQPSLNEADTCRLLVVPKLQAAGWDTEPARICEQVTFTDDAPLRTRRERAQRMRTERRDFFARFEGAARQVLDELLPKYTEHGAAQFVIPEVLEVPPIRGVGARRERTRPEQFLNLELPMPNAADQERGESIFTQLNPLRRMQSETIAELDALLPSVLDRAFKGEPQGRRRRKIESEALASHRLCRGREKSADREAVCL